jgi:CheY-like chemotaxis protein
MKCVLICDDDTEIVNVCTIILKKKGYEVITTQTSENIFDMVENKRPDLILMDLWIPEMGGEAATVKLKQNPETKDIPIILFSAHNDVEQVAKRIHAEGFLPKPFRISELEDVLNKHLNAANLEIADLD